MMPKRRTSSVPILALALATALPALPALGATPEEAVFVEETREYLGRLERLGFAGVVLAARGGAPLLAEGFGLADRERGDPWSPGTVSTVGSITKQFTGAEEVAFVWQGEPEGRLLGISSGGLPPRLCFRAEASGALAAWDPRSGGTVWLTTEGADADTRLRFGRGEQALEARRAETGVPEPPSAPD